MTRTVVPAPGVLDTSSVLPADSTRCSLDAVVSLMLFLLALTYLMLGIGDAGTREQPWGRYA